MALDDSESWYTFFSIAEKNKAVAIFGTVMEFSNFSIPVYPMSKGFNSLVISPVPQHMHI